MLWSVCEFLFLVFLSPLTFFVYVPFILSVILINEGARLAVSLLLRLRGTGQFLCPNGEDAVWEYRQPGNTRMVLIPIITRGTGIRAPDLVALFREKIFKGGPDGPQAKLGWLIGTAFGYVCWDQDAVFDLQRHVRTEEKEVREEEMMGLLSDLTEDMSPNRPQWEIILLPHYKDAENDSKSVLIFRFHHAYGDGMSLLMMMAELSPDFTFAINPLTFSVPLWKRVAFYMNALLHTPSTILGMGIHRLRTHWLTDPGVSVSARKSLGWTRLIDLDLLRRVRQRTGSSIPLLMATAFVDACRRVVPSQRLVHTVRVGEVIALLPYPDSSLRNRFSYFSYSVPARAPLSDRGLAQGERARGRSLAQGAQALLIFYGFKVIGRLPLRLYSALCSGAMDSLYLSNVPVSRASFSLCGSEVEGIGAYPPIPNSAGLIMGSVSYGTDIRLCVQAHPAFITRPELGRILEEVWHGIQALEPKSTANGRIPSETILAISGPPPPKPILPIQRSAILGNNKGRRRRGRAKKRT